MDPGVLQALARWPNVPAVYGWLALDRRGNWLLKNPAGEDFGRIGNVALREFIGRNYAADGHGRWYFQNGPQRVYVALAYAPLVLHYDGDALIDHCGHATRAQATFVDEEGSVLILGERGLGLLDDRDLALFATRIATDWRTLRKVSSRDVAARFGFVCAPSDSLR